MAAKKTTLEELGEMLAHVVKHMATKEDIAEVRRDMATKDELAAARWTLRARPSSNLIATPSARQF